MATTPATAMSSGSSLLEGSRSNGGGGSLMPSNLSASAAQFREIHKNTWLKRLTAEGKKITIGPKKSERSWVVFCVHDDTEALLEGYAEPRQAASHSPEWIVSLQDTLHISHALIPNSHEFEFVVTLSNEVVRFHAMSWEIMQEWVETLRSKLREMKILSPRENLYTKLPEIRAPLLPTRDPTSPLPAPPPVPAALVPGVERVVPQSALQDSNAATTATTSATESNTVMSNTAIAAPSLAVNSTNSSNNSSSIPLSSTSSTTVSSSAAAAPITMAPLTSMSNTLTQNLLNMLSDPISTYSEHLNGEAADDSNLADDDDDDDSSSEKDLNLADFNDKYLPLLLRKSSVLLVSQQAAGTSSVVENSVRVDIGAENRSSADQIKNFENLFQCERLIPRPQTSRSLSAGAADKSRKQTAKFASHHNTSSNALTTCSSNNITELEICSETTTQSSSSTVTTCPDASTGTNADTTASADSKTNITIIQVSTNAASNQENESDPPKLPTKSTIGEIFKFPEAHTAAAATTTKTKLHEYKSNVQIIPSNLNSSTIQVLGQNNVAATAVANQYSTPVKKSLQSAAPTASSASSSTSIVTTTTTGTHVDNHKITTVHVAGDESQTNSSTTTMYGTCYTPNTAASQSTPKLPKKIILSANTSGITNISVNNASDTSSNEAAIRNNCGAASAAAGDSGVKHNVGNVHYEKVFLSSSIPITTAASTTTISTAAVPASPKLSTQWNWPRRQAQASVSSSTQTASHAAAAEVVTPAVPKSSASTAETKTSKPAAAQSSAHNRNMSAPIPHIGGSPAMQRRRIASPTNVRLTERSSQPPLPTRPPFLTRGLTEAVITTRPSRKDFHFLKLTPSKTKSNLGGNNGSSNTKNTVTTSNNNGETASTSTNSAHQPLHAAVNRTNSESLEQRRRSSSTSDAQAQRNTRGTNNNEFPGNRAGSSALRIQQPPQPFRSNIENGATGSGGVSPPTTTTTSPAAKRLTLREQQVMQMRREIMHPGGVRLQLRRKDCVGSIAWVDAFGAVWVAGWKQKEHPVLYNALHIGDQLLSIAGITTSSAAEANKIIRNANTLFVEVLVRRIPFGRGYAIRREREGQCLGLIRDGNTSTIVDVVPNSLAARHGLPPKAQSCDGTTLTFWILTEINGRPLNLFFKENEIRDRLNSVGRDISILVQPSDLITKLKKQLKSLRGYKDYLVQ